MPGEGNNELIKLHDKLYTGILSKELRLDIPFMPHIEISASKIPEEAKIISDNLNNKNICFEGNITEMDLVEFDYPKIKTIKKYLLNTPAD